MDLFYSIKQFGKLFKDLLTGWEVFYSGSEDGFFTNYSWYHIMWLVIMVVACVTICLTLANKHDKRIDNIVIFSFGSFLLLIEIYKQIFLTLDGGGYQWYIFPFQFCSVPMYVAFISPLIKNEKIKDACFKFLAFYGFLAGVSVMLYPDSCFSTHYLTILIHTMAWHSSMVVMGIYLIISRGFCKDIKKFFSEVLYGGLILLVLMTIAITANYLTNSPRVAAGQDTLFNLMYLSPYDSGPLPILSDIWGKVPFPVYALCYLLAFTLGISLVWFIVFGIRKLCSLAKNKKFVEAN